MSTEIRVPDIGDFKNVEIIEVLVKEGDQINKNDPIITLESDKSSVEVPSPFSGTISELKIKVGDKISQGDLVGFMSVEGEAESKPEPKEKILPETERIIKDAEENLNQESSSGIVEIQVPDIGDFKEIEIIEVLVKQGNEIKKGDPIITLESDKSSMEVPSPISGTIKEIKVKVGDKVSKGSIIGTAESQDQVLKVEHNQKEKLVDPISTETVSRASRIEIKNQKIYTGMPNINDIDPEETNEWIESLEGVVKRDGAERAHYLLTQLIDQAYIAGSTIPFTQKTPYVNTIPTELEAKSPGNQEIEKK